MNQSKKSELKRAKIAIKTQVKAGTPARPALKWF